MRFSLTAFSILLTFTLGSAQKISYLPPYDSFNLRRLQRMTNDYSYNLVLACADEACEFLRIVRPNQFNYDNYNEASLAVVDTIYNGLFWSDNVNSIPFYMLIPKRQLELASLTEICNGSQLIFKDSELYIPLGYPYSDMIIIAAMLTRGAVMFIDDFNGYIILHPPSWKCD